jgi:hypothetical protein
VLPIYPKARIIPISPETNTFPPVAPLMQRPSNPRSSHNVGAILLISGPVFQDSSWNQALAFHLLVKKVY